MASFSHQKSLVFLTVTSIAASVCIPTADYLERPCNRGQEFNLTGLRALIITTSHDKLGAENCTTCKPTGVTLTEADVPYWVFKDAGLLVDVASIRGGKIPDDGTRLTHWDCRLLNDQQSYGQFEQSLKIDDLDFASYDIVYMAGGWGASWDLGYSDVLGDGITKAFAAGKLVGSVCHGALGFLRAKKPDGSLLVNGTRMTGVTNRQIEALGLAKLEPMHPEEELRNHGAVYECHHGVAGVVDIMESDVVVDNLTSDGRIITGQNQNSACGVAQEMLTRLQSDKQELYAWVPTDCKSPVKICYEGLYSDLMVAVKEDPVNFCRYGGDAEVKKGTCSSFGYSKHPTFPLGPIVHDPIFRKVTIWVEDKKDYVSTPIIV